MNTWIKSAWTDAAQIVGLMDAEADTGPAAGRSLPDWFAGLIAAQDYAAALKFLAHAMSRYDCIVWAARTVFETGMADRGDPRLTATLRWIDNPENDEVRRDAGELAEQVAATSPGKLLAHAVFFSGGSIAPPQYPALQPAPDVCSKFAYSAILIGAYTLPDPQAAMRQALNLGEAMISGKG